MSTYAYDTNSPSKHQLVTQYDRFGTSTSFTYNSAGNQVTRGGQSQSFDEFNRVTSVRDDAGAVVNLAWYRDEMKLKSWSRPAAELCNLFQYDADGRVRRVEQIADDDCVGTSNYSVEYAFDQSGLASFKTGGVWYYLDRSARGDITGIRNSSGTLQATIRYSAYGEVWTDNQALVDKLAMTYDGAEGVVSLGGGLYWMQHRVYAATQGRFISADPMEAKAGTTASAYNYADGDPISKTDPTGERAALNCDVRSGHVRGGIGIGRRQFVFTYRTRCTGIARVSGIVGVTFCAQALNQGVSVGDWSNWWKCSSRIHWAGHVAKGRQVITVPGRVRWCRNWAFWFHGWAWAPGTVPGTQWSYRTVGRPRGC